MVENDDLRDHTFWKSFFAFFSSHESPILVKVGAFFSFFHGEFKNAFSFYQNPRVCPKIAFLVIEAKFFEDFLIGNLRILVLFFIWLRNFYFDKKLDGIFYFFTLF